VRQACALRDPGSHRDGPVGAGRDDPIDLERASEPLDRRLVLGREDATAAGEAKARRTRIAIDDSGPDAARVRCLEQSELCGTGP